MFKLIQHYPLSCTILLVMVAVTLFGLHELHSSAQAHTNCLQIENLKGAIRLVVGQGVSSLGHKGSAGYAYYISHPQELAAAKVAGAQELLIFKPTPC